MPAWVDRVHRYANARERGSYQGAGLDPNEALSWAGCSKRKSSWRDSRIEREGCSHACSKVAKTQTKDAASSTSNLVHQRSALVAHSPNHYSAEQAIFLERTIGNQATLCYLTNRLSDSTESEDTNQKLARSSGMRRGHHGT